MPLRTAMTRSCRSWTASPVIPRFASTSHLIAVRAAVRQANFIPPSTIVKISISHHTRSIRSLRGDPVADPGDDLERPVSRILIVDEGQDHQLVGRRFVDQRLGPTLHRLWRADDGVARPVFDARALLNGSERVKVSRGPQQRAACSTQVFCKDLLKRAEETLRPASVSAAAATTQIIIYGC